MGSLSDDVAKIVSDAARRNPTVLEDATRADGLPSRDMTQQEADALLLDLICGLATAVKRVADEVDRLSDELADGRK